MELNGEQTREGNQEHRGQEARGSLNVVEEVVGEQNREEGRDTRIQPVYQDGKPESPVLPGVDIRDALAALPAVLELLLEFFVVGTLVFLLFVVVVLLGSQGVHGLVVDAEEPCPVRLCPQGDTNQEGD